MNVITYFRISYRLCLLFVVSFISNHVFSQAHITLSHTNFVVTSNEIQWDYYIVNDGTVPLKFNSANFRLTHGASIIPPGSNTYAFTYVVGTSDFAASNHATNYTSPTRLFQMVQSTANYPEFLAISLPFGVPMRVGRFSLKITNTNWVAGQLMDFAYFSTGNGAILYVDGNIFTRSHLKNTL